MQANDFEKRVQDQMQVLNLDPSPAVWDSVERRIRKEKKRRFLPWWPIALLLVAGGITAGILLGGNTEKKVPVTAKQDPTTGVPQKPVIIPEPETNKPTSANNTGKEPGDNIRNENGTVTPNRDQNETAITANKPRPSRPVLQENPSHKNNRTVVPADRLKPAKPVVNEKKEEPLTAKEPITVLDKPGEKQQVEQPPAKTTEPGLPEKEDKTAVTTVNTIKDLVSPADSVQQMKSEPIVTASVDSTLQTQVKKTAAVKQGKTIWGMAVSAGRSTITDGPGLFKSNRRMESNSLQTGSPGNIASLDRSANDPSFAWSAGIWFRNQLKPRLFLEGGLGYMYLSNKIYVGARVDSTRLVNNTYSQGVSVDNFYRPTGSQSYTNNYHFLRLHAGLSWQFLRNKKFRPEWENGLEYNRLIGSSMLHYDWNLPGYYRDNKLLTKNHLFYYTGLQFPAGKRAMVNPYASFSMTRVLRNNDSLRTNFSQWGIRLKINLGKK